MNHNENCVVITDEKNWIEQAAKDQLFGISQLKGVKNAVGLPDLHPGKSPVGIALLTEGYLYPHLIGNDIGCGMGLFDTGIKSRKFKQEKAVTRLNYIKELSELATMNPYQEESPISDLGTIGSGNHFAEFQNVGQIVDEELFDQTGIEKDRILLLIHSGSRGYGQRILNRFYRPEGLIPESPDGAAYLAEHSNALLWAKRNRYLTAEKLVEYLGYAGPVLPILDLCHNYLEPMGNGWIHRKGAVSSKEGFLVIPGSRGSCTYLCKPAGNTEISLDTLSHGSGRKWARSICKSRIDGKYDRDTIRTTALKSRVVCHDTNLLFQEVPEAYKNVDDIIRVLKAYDLIKVAALLKPVITFKG